MDKQSKGYAMTAALVALIGVSMLAALALLNRKDRLVGLNQEIQYDDFAFSVEGVRKTDTLGQGDSRLLAHGHYYVATLKIANHAKRVDFKFKKNSPVLIDSDGWEYGIDLEAQAVLDGIQAERCNKPIPAGFSCTTEVVFDVPPEARVTQLRISGGGLVIDILDVMFFGKKRIDLGSLQ